MTDSRSPREHHVRRLMTPAIRAYIRYAPWRLAKPFLYNKVFWQPRDFVATTTFGGTMRGNTADVIQRYVYYFGMWEPSLTHWLQSTLRPGDAFVDVGANVGYYSLLASQRVGSDGRVLAIEASPSIYQQLLANLAANGVQNVNAQCVAAGETTGTIPIFKGPEKNIGRTSTVRPGADAVPEAEVPMKPLAELIPPDLAAKTRVVKIDVEGAELQVLRGLLPLARREDFRADISLEVTPQSLAANGETYAGLCAELRAAGYFPYRIENVFDHRDYIRRAPPTPPVRYEGEPREQVDMVFSKRDAAQL